MDLDKPLPRDVQLVLAVAAALEISEHQVFLLAFKRWAGDDACEERLEPIFVRYMFESRVPPWVCTFGDEVLDAVRSGELDKEQLSGDASATAEVGRAMRYGVIIVVVTVVLVVLAQASATLLELGERCVFPPCY